MRGTQVFTVVFAAVFFAILTAIPVHADLQKNLQVMQFEINNMDLAAAMDEANALDNEVFERGETLEIQLKVKNIGNTSLDDFRVSAEIVGDRYARYRLSDTYDFSQPSTLDAGKSKSYTLKLIIPDDLETKEYKLRLRMDDANSFGFDQTYQLSVEGIDSSKAIKIDDFSFSPQEIVVGRAFTSLVRVENLGDSTLKDLKVTVAIPELNIEDTQYMDTDSELEPDDIQKFEQLLLRIPMDAKPGTYDVTITVNFDRYEEVTAKGTVRIVAEKPVTGTGTGSQDGPTTITATPNQDIVPGASAVYPILIENGGNAAKTYTITVSGLSDWATYTLEPSSVVNVAAGSKETVLLTVTAKDDAKEGQKAFVASIDTSTGTIQKALTANIAKGSSGTNWSKVQDGLTIGLIVLVIILIILGLIIGFSKLRGNDREEEKTQTYY